jgi:hypothetical protein
VSNEYTRIQMLLSEELHSNFGHETAHLSRDEQIRMAIYVANSFNNVAAELIQEREEERAAAETSPAQCDHSWVTSNFEAPRCLWCHVEKSAAETCAAPDPAPAGCEEWWHLKPYGYAPGGYTMKCPHCQVTVWHVDKRARCCKQCAIAFYESAQSAQNR